MTSTSLKKIRGGAISLTAIVIASIIGFHFLGGYGWIDSIWMVVITISTVGFAEHSQLDTPTQLLTIVVIILGVSTAVYTSGGFLQVLMEGEVEKALGYRKMHKEISRLRNHVIICGFGRLGQDLAHQLQHRNLEFVVIENEPAMLDFYDGNRPLMVVGNAMDEATLNEAGLARARSIVAALSTDADNVFITLTARNLNPRVQIISKSERESSCAKLRQAGADKIVMPHQVGARQMERMISRPTTADLIELFAEASDHEMELDEFQISHTGKLVGQSIRDTDIKKNYNLLIVGVKRQDGDLQFNPPASSVLLEGDTLLVLGGTSNIGRFKDHYEL